MSQSISKPKAPALQKKSTKRRLQNKNNYNKKIVIITSINQEIHANKQLVTSPFFPTTKWRIGSRLFLHCRATPHVLCLGKKRQSGAVGQLSFAQKRRVVGKDVFPGVLRVLFCGVIIAWCSSYHFIIKGNFPIFGSNFVAFGSFFGVWVA